MCERRLVSFGTAGARDWSDRPVAIVGGGPSLQGFDFGRLRSRFTVVAVNASMFDLPFADAGFSIDIRAARNWWPKIRNEVRFPFYLAIDNPVLDHFSGPPPSSVVFLRRVQGTALSTNPVLISAGGTSGFGALHLSFLKGAKRITLFGFDYQPSAVGEWHHNEQHYFPHRQRLWDWQKWARNFDAAASVLRQAGVEVVNASPGSAITAFRRVSIEEALA